MTAEFIVSGMEVDFTPAAERAKEDGEDPPEGFPKRPDRTTRIEMASDFTKDNDDRHDAGFGI